MMIDHKAYDFVFFICESLDIFIVNVTYTT